MCAAGSSQHLADAALQGLDDRRAGRRPDRVHDHQIAQMVAKLRRVGRGLLQQIHDLGLGAVEAFLEQEAAIEDRAAAIGHARRLDAVHRLTAEDRR